MIPEFDYLKDCKWSFTEKIDGTNMRLIFQPGAECGTFETKPSGQIAEVGTPDTFPPYFQLLGRSDAAQVHGTLTAWLESWQSFALPLATELFDSPVCIYGEGCGAGIQKGGEQYGGTHFRAFAIKVGNWWLEPSAVDDICRTLHIQQVPHILSGTLMDGIELVESGLDTFIGPHSGVFRAEGLIGIPEVPLCRRDGSRIVVKLKHKDLCHDVPEDSL